MMMTAVLRIVTRMSNAHVTQTETTPKSALDRRPVLRPHEIEKGIFWRGLSLSVGSARQTCQRSRQHNELGDPHEHAPLKFLRRKSYPKSVSWISNVRVVTVAVRWSDIP